VSGLNPKPDIIIAADWSVNPRKRWRSTITRDGGGWVLHPAEPVGENLLRDTVSHDAARSLVGFDFPIGIPLAYAQVAGVECFRTLLAGIGRASPWERFWEAVPPTEAPSVHRPLYPAKNGVKGSVKKATLVSGIGVESYDSLKREIDRRQNAECMFWSLGAKQVAKACFVGWREELQPMLGSVLLWPFDGSLAELNATPGVVVCEIYPAAAARRIEAKILGSKGEQDHRRGVARALFDAATRNNCRVEPMATLQIETGFAEGDDAFDACIGVIAMLDVVNTYSDIDEPPSDIARDTEGWILGVS
jgi:hypothetical protein